MKRILITGANSYVGTNVERWLNREPDKYHVDTIDMIDGSWREKDFSGYDVVFHVAGIAHVKETRKNRDLFFKVNRDLPIEVAKVSKKAGVSQFIFLSSMSVYGMDTGVITKETVPKPKNSYGKSKLQAEQEIKMLESDNFKIAILRPPMIYGKGCKGNFQKIVKYVNKFPIFPKLQNLRSFIYIDNLCSFVKMCIDDNLSGLFFPQNRRYMNTTKMAEWVAMAMNKKMYISKSLGVAVKPLQLFFDFSKKAFGSLIYFEMEDFEYCYCLFELEESVKMSVRKVVENIE